MGPYLHVHALNEVVPMCLVSDTDYTLFSAFFLYNTNYVRPPPRAQPRTPVAGAAPPPRARHRCNVFVFSVRAAQAAGAFGRWRLRGVK